MINLGILSLVTLCILLLIAIPIAFSEGIVSLLLLVFGPKDIPLIAIPQRLVNFLDMFPIMAVPFFILAGEIMNSAGLTQKIVDFSDGVVGRFRGGLSLTNCVTNLILGGISGSMIADTAATGKILIPAMKKKGYGAGFSAAVTASASIAGPIIPPSIPMVIYGSMASVRVDKLFVGGIIPGILAIVSLMIICYFVAAKRGYEPPRKISLRETYIKTRDGGLALLMPIIIVGGIVGGVFTPTEAAAFAVFYAVIIGVFVYKSLTWKMLFEAGENAAIMTAQVLIIYVFSCVFTFVLIIYNIPQFVTENLLAMTSNPYVLLAILNAFMLLLGCFLDPLSGIAIMVPLVMSTVKALGISPVHFGVMMVFNLCIGLLTPPIGMSLFLAANIAETSVEDTVRELIPFLIALVAVLVIITYVPQTVTWLPDLLIKS
jgi:C4-dicarboxylate transporter, DctM subunit